jgi:hypothetical protein
MTTEIYATIMISNELDIEGLADGVPVAACFTVAADPGDEDEEPGVMLRDNEAISVWLTADMAKALSAELTRAVDELPAP